MIKWFGDWYEKKYGPTDEQKEALNVSEDKLRVICELCDLLKCDYYQLVRKVKLYKVTNAMMLAAFEDVGIEDAFELTELREIFSVQQDIESD